MDILDGSSMGAVTVTIRHVIRCYQDRNTKIRPTCELEQDVPIDWAAKEMVDPCKFHRYGHVSGFILDQDMGPDCRHKWIWKPYLSWLV